MSSYEFCIHQGPCNSWWWRATVLPNARFELVLFTFFHQVLLIFTKLFHQLSSTFIKLFHQVLSSTFIQFKLVSANLPTGTRSFWALLMQDRRGLFGCLHIVLRDCAQDEAAKLLGHAESWLTTLPDTCFIFFHHLSLLVNSSSILLNFVLLDVQCYSMLLNVLMYSVFNSTLTLAIVLCLYDSLFVSYPLVCHLVGWMSQHHLWPRGWLVSLCKWEFGSIHPTVSRMQPRRSQY